MALQTLRHGTSNTSVAAGVMLSLVPQALTMVQVSAMHCIRFL